MPKFCLMVRDSLVREEGASLAEYGLLVALIAVVCIAAVGFLGEGVKGTFEAITAVL